jgi:hypothetical protein
LGEKFDGEYIFSDKNLYFCQVCRKVADANEPKTRHLHASRSLIHNLRDPASFDAMRLGLQDEHEAIAKGRATKSTKRIKISPSVLSPGARADIYSLYFALNKDHLSVYAVVHQPGPPTSGWIEPLVQVNEGHDDQQLPEASERVF